MLYFTIGQKKSGTYGEFAHLAVGAPIPKGVKLKNIKDFKIVRTAQKNVEGSKIIGGKPLFGLDYKHEGMLIAMIHHPPGFGMKIKSFNADESLKMPGIKDIFQIKLYDEAYAQAGFDTRTFNDLLVVVGSNTWEVMNARKKLIVEWIPTGDTKDMMAGRGEAREVIVLPKPVQPSKRLKIFLKPNGNGWLIRMLINLPSSLMTKRNLCT